MPFFAKAVVDEELARLERLVAAQETRVRQAFAVFVRDATDERLIRAAADLLDLGDIEGALRLLESHIARFGAVLPTVYTQAGQAETSALAPLIADLVPTVAVSFDPTDTRAAMRMRQNTLEFIVGFTDKQRLATRQALIRGLETGRGTVGNATAFRDSIGLTASQEATVSNYRRLLQTGSREALDRQLRDRRFDPSVERAASGGDPLTQEQIDRMVDRYRTRMLAMRAETIARTETTRTVEEAREEALRQNMAQAGIPDRAVKQTWNATGDNRTRDTHAGMNGQQVPLGQSFQSSSGATLRYPGDPLAPVEEVANCRCRRTFQIDSEAVSQAA